jgi:hypothetical protein
MNAPSSKKYVIRDVTTEEYLASFDPDVREPGVDYPTGYAEWTSVPGEAMTFPTHAEALIFWKTQSTATPLRPDGKPNRPLTAFSISVERLEVPQ